MPSASTASRSPLDRRALDEESALRADRHDDGVLDHLRLDQAEHFGAEIFAPIGPAQSAARDRPEAQVHAFDARRRRPRSRDMGAASADRRAARIELEADVVVMMRRPAAGSNWCAASRADTARKLRRMRSSSRLSTFSSRMRIAAMIASICFPRGCSRTVTTESINPGLSLSTSAPIRVSSSPRRRACAAMHGDRHRCRWRCGSNFASNSSISNPAIAG